MVIPLCFGTTCGLVVRAMDLPLSAAEGNAGLVPPAAGYALLGEAYVPYCLDSVHKAGNLSLYIYNTCILLMVEGIMYSLEW